jgi:predicted nucleotidyltransferase
MRSDNDLKLVKRSLEGLRSSDVKAVLVFGSRARGESKERSDIDLLILHEGNAIEDPVERRRGLYSLLRESLGDQFEEITLIDMKLQDFLRPAEVTPLLLNIYWDGIVVYDKTQALHDFLKNIRERIVKSGLRRVANGRAYWWDLPEPIKEVKIL